MEYLLPILGIILIGVVAIAILLVSTILMVCFIHRIDDVNRFISLKRRIK